MDYNKWTSWMPWGKYTGKIDVDPQWVATPTSDSSVEKSKASLTTELKGKLSNFIGTTSIKGVGKAQKTKSTFLRCLWLLSTVTGLSICVFIITVLTSDYIQREIVTKLEDCPN